MSDTRTFPNRGITSKLRVRFERAPGIILYAKDLAEEFNVEERLVQQTVANIRREHNGQPLVHIPAQAWVYQPGAQQQQASATRVFEQLAVTKAGELVLQDHEGKLYRAVEL